jgi:predicted nucleic acid-binding protein
MSSEEIECRDGLYLAVPESLEAALVTAHRKFAAAAQRDCPHARMLGD